MMLYYLPTEDSTRPTCVAFHRLSRLVVCPIVFNQSAIFCKLSPLARIVLMIGSRSAWASFVARWLASAAALAASFVPANLRSSRPFQCPGRADPSFTPRALAAASAAFVRSEMATGVRDAPVAAVWGRVPGNRGTGRCQDCLWDAPQNWRSRSSHDISVSYDRAGLHRRKWECQEWVVGRNRFAIGLDGIYHAGR